MKYLETQFTTAMIRRFKPLFEEFDVSGVGGIIFNVDRNGFVNGLYLSEARFERLQKYVKKLMKEAGIET